MHVLSDLMISNNTHREQDLYLNSQNLICLHSKPCQTSEMELFRKLLPATEVNSEFCKTFMMELLRFYNDYLTNVMKVFVFFGMSAAKEGCFYRYFHIL